MKGLRKKSRSLADGNSLSQATGAAALIGRRREVCSRGRLLSPSSSMRRVRRRSAGGEADVKRLLGS